MFKEKINQDIFHRSKMKNMGFFPQTGYSEEEYDYRLVTSDMDDFKDYYFIVSKFISFKANSIENKGFRVYVYDKEGNYVNNPEIQKKCRGGFFETIKDVE